MARGAVILAALAVLSAAPASAQISEKRRELAKIQSELRRAQQELEQLRAAENSLGRDVDRLQGLDADSRRRSHSLQDTIRVAELRREDLRARLAAASKVGGFWSAALTAETARHAAAAAARSDFYGTGELWAEEYSRVAILEKARHVRGLQGFQRRTEEDAARARQKSDALDRSGRRAQAERDKRRREYENKKAQLEKTQTRLAEATRRARELEESAKAMTGLIEKLGRAAAAVPKPAPGVVASLDRAAHSLPWPAAGRVLTGYGREKDPELGTTIVRQGLTLATAAAAPVTPVADGKVIFSGPFRSYGNVVILDHGRGFFSIYGSLGEILTSKGQPARAGEPIGRAGAAPGGGRVYLEIRKGTQALDPKAWLETKP